MSRIRSVHPGFFRDDRLVPCSAFARLLFIGLGVEADDKGIFEWKPVTIKMSVFPGDNVNVDELLEELVDADAVRQFEAAGKRYGAIRNFRKYQKPKTPNDIHPMVDGIAEYVSLPPKVETDTSDGPRFPQKGEIAPQREEGGGNGKGKSPPLPPSGGIGADDALFEEIWKSFPKAPTSNPKAARGQFNMLTPPERERLLDAAQRYRRWWQADCKKRGQSEADRLTYVPHLSKWIQSGAWEHADDLPAIGVAPETDWLSWCKAFANDGTWKASLGPNPDEPGCRAPPDIIQKTQQERAA